MSIDTIFLILLTALCAWLDGTLIISLVRARKIGIVRVIFPANLTGLVLMVCLMAGLVFLSAESAASSRKYSDYVADMGTRGIEAVAEYENRTVDSYFEAIVTEKKEDYAAHIVSIEKPDTKSRRTSPAGNRGTTRFPPYRSCCIFRALSLLSPRTV